MRPKSVLAFPLGRCYGASEDDSTVVSVAVSGVTPAAVVDTSSSETAVDVDGDSPPPFPLAIKAEMNTMDMAIANTDHPTQPLLFFLGLSLKSEGNPMVTLL